jgi:hypothetical protein
MWSNSGNRGRENMASDEGFADQYIKNSMGQMINQAKEGKIRLDTGKSDVEGWLKNKLQPVVDEWRNLSEEQEEQLEKVAKDILAGPKTVDLVMYLGGERKIVGKATVVEGVVFANVDEKLMDANEITAAVTNGLVESLTLSVQMVPVREQYESQLDFHPPYNPPFAGRMEWLGMEKIRLDPEDAQMARGSEEPWKDKFPYGPK